MRLRLTASLAALTLLVACTARDASDQHAAGSSAASALAAPPPVHAHAATLALAGYLDASREGSATRAALDTLADCGDGDGPYLPISMLAAYELLPPLGQGDTLVGRAVVVTVAEQSADRRNAGRNIARQRVRRDTVEWDVMRDAVSGRWVVCNGLQFGYAAPDSLTEWRPAGASYRSARALADSLFAAQSAASTTTR